VRLSPSVMRGIASGHLRHSAGATRSTTALHDGTETVRPDRKTAVAVGATSGLASALAVRVGREERREYYDEAGGFKAGRVGSVTEASQRIVTQYVCVHHQHIICAPQCTEEQQEDSRSRTQKSRTFVCRSIYKVWDIETGMIEFPGSMF